MVTVEPGVYVPGRFGVRIEDLVFVTDEGVRNLSSLPKELRVVDYERRRSWVGGLADGLRRPHSGLLREVAEWRPAGGVVSAYVAIDPADRGEGWRIELKNQACRV